MSEYAVFAGRGKLPEYVVKQIPDIKIICFEGENNSAIKPDLITKFGKIGQILEYLKANEVKKLIFAGAMNRPDLKSLTPDGEGAKLLAKIMAASFFGMALGDDKLLNVITKFFEDKGFEVIGVQEVLKNILAEKGVLGEVQLVEQQIKDIETAITIFKRLGELDIGQALVVENGIVLAVEAAEGTEKMISRAGNLKKSYGGILLKFKKPEQNEKADLPAIGPDTITQIKAAGIAGIAVQAGGTMMLDKDEIIKNANQAGVFLIGV